MLVLNSRQVEQALPPESAFDAMQAAFLAISSGTANIPSRVHLPIAAGQATTLVMPAYCEIQQAEVLSVKVVSIVDGNTNRRLPRVLGALLVLDGKTGQPLGMLDGAAVTAIRTAAATAVATDLLARADAQSLGIMGAGVLLMRPGIVIFHTWFCSVLGVNPCISSAFQLDPFI